MLGYTIHELFIGQLCYNGDIVQSLSSFCNSFGLLKHYAIEIAIGSENQERYWHVQRINFFLTPFLVSPFNFIMKRENYFY